MKRPLLLKLKAIEKTKNQLAELRDKLREQIDDLEGILDSCVESIDCLDDGLRAFQDAQESLSKYL